MVRLQSTQAKEKKKKYMFSPVLFIKVKSKIEMT